jgi:4-hydroxybenzoate polyprenyltransferase
MSSLVLLLIGLGTFFFALRSKEEIHRIATMVTGTIFLIWGFALAPLPFQLAFEIISVLAAFFVCMRCLGCGLNQD